MYDPFIILFSLFFISSFSRPSARPPRTNINKKPIKTALLPCSPLSSPSSLFFFTSSKNLQRTYERKKKDLSRTLCLQQRKRNIDASPTSPSPHPPPALALLSLPRHACLNNTICTLLPLLFSLNTLRCFFSILPPPKQKETFTPSPKSDILPCSPSIVRCHTNPRPRSPSTLRCAPASVHSHPHPSNAARPRTTSPLLPDYPLPNPPLL